MLQMDMENSSINRDISMKDSGKIIWQMEGGKLFMLMKVGITDNLSTIRGMETESSCRNNPSFKDSLSTTS